MGIEYKENVAVFTGIVSIQEVDTLLEWLLENPDAGIDLSTCDHMHTAALQTLISARRVISQWPVNAELRHWLEPILTTEVTSR